MPSSQTNKRTTKNSSKSNNSYTDEQIAIDIYAPYDTEESRRKAKHTKISHDKETLPETCKYYGRRYSFSST